MTPMIARKYYLCSECRVHLSITEESTYYNLVRPCKCTNDFGTAFWKGYNRAVEDGKRVKDIVFPKIVPTWASLTDEQYQLVLQHGYELYYVNQPNWNEVVTIVCGEEY